MSDSQEFGKETMPFVAPCRSISPLAPFGWLKKGMADLRRAPQQSLTYGFFMALVMATVVWLSLIMLGLLIGLLTAFVGLIVILPVIGYGAWHGYLETIDASAFPRHTVGITATPRNT